MIPESLYFLLMELATDQQVVPPSGVNESENLTALACTCLLSLVIARGDTGKLLSAVAAMLMSLPALATQQIKVVLKTPLLFTIVFTGCGHLACGKNVAS